MSNPHTQVTNGVMDSISPFVEISGVGVLDDVGMS